MDDDDKPVMIYATFPDKASAAVAGEALVAKRLAACVNIITGMTAIYNWQGRVERSEEVVMIVKTRASLADAAIAEGRQLHSYTTPAFVKLALIGGDAGYLAWLLAETGKQA